MEPIETVLAELQSRYAEVPYKDQNRILDSDVANWCATLQMSRDTLYNQLAWHLALGFNTRVLSFEYCDWILNDIHAVITWADEIRPEPFWSIFLAFDEGEHYHGGNRDEDPVDKYTRPEVARVLELFLEGKGIS